MIRTLNSHPRHRTAARYDIPSCLYLRSPLLVVTARRRLVQRRVVVVGSALQKSEAGMQSKKWEVFVSILPRTLETGEWIMWPTILMKTCEDGKWVYRKLTIDEENKYIFNNTW